MSSGPEPPGVDLLVTARGRERKIKPAIKISLALLITRQDRPFLKSKSIANSNF